MTDQQRIAIVEDSPEILELLTESLSDAGYEVQGFRRAIDFENAFKQLVPDLCIVDLGLPDKDGLNLVSSIARVGDAAILVISGRAALQDKIVGLELGADDYLAKPFEMAEVIARVRALIRRKTPNTPVHHSTVYKFSGWTMDCSKFELTDAEGVEVKLSASEVNLLQYFLTHANRLVTRAQLCDDLNDHSDEYAFDRAIDVRVSRLRSKLRDPSKNPKIIKTIYGAGYIFISDDE